RLDRRVQVEHGLAGRLDLLESHDSLQARERRRGAVGRARHACGQLAELARDLRGQDLAVAGHRGELVVELVRGQARGLDRAVEPGPLTDRGVQLADVARQYDDPLALAVRV